jgi:ubiquinone/menaquinone biosynthesis C-methylase UbiE
MEKEYKPEEYWQERGNRYNIPRSQEKYREISELIYMQVVKYWRIQSVLDVGSGYGRMYKVVKDYVTKSKTPLEYTMCDFVDSFIKQCRKRTGVRPIKWDGKRLPFENEKFDLVASVEVMLHVKNEAIENFIAEHVRVAKRYLYIETVDHGELRTRLSYYCFNHPYRSLFNKFKLEKVFEFREFMDRRVVWLLKK